VPRPSRKAHQIEQVREAILDAATAVFARSGFRAATMSEIAAQAGYTAPSLYNYFPGKHQIFDALHARLHAEIMAVFDAPAPRGAGFVERLEDLIRRQLRLVYRRRETVKLFLALQLGADAAPAELAGRRHAEAFARFIARLAAWIRAAARGQDLGGRDPEQLAYLLWGIGNAFHVRWLQRGADEPPTDMARDLLDLFLHGLRGRSPARSRKRARS